MIFCKFPLPWNKVVDVRPETVEKRSLVTLGLRDMMGDTKGSLSSSASCN